MVMSGHTIFQTSYLIQTCLTAFLAYLFLDNTLQGVTQLNHEMKKHGFYPGPHNLILRGTMVNMTDILFMGKIPYQN